MRSVTLTGAAMLAAALMTGCGADSGPTAANTAGPLADATSSQTVDHFSINEPFPGADVFVNPCNGETIQFIGTLVGQVTTMLTHFELWRATPHPERGPRIGAVAAAQGTIR